MRTVCAVLLALFQPLVAHAQAAGEEGSPTAPGARAPATPDAAPAAKADASFWQVGGQGTLVTQGDFGVPGSFRGANSLSPAAQTRETVDLTLYAGLRPWKGAEIWISPEIDQGFGLSDTLGAAGFPSGEAYKVGAASPYIRLQRLFFRQTLDLGGDKQDVDRDLFTFAASPTKDRLVLTAGKLSVGDVFDTNAYAHDPRGDFLNWTLIDTGTFDYAADAWGYSYGATLEWYTGDWTLRSGGFSMSKIPNGSDLNSTFAEYQFVGELERRYRLFRREGKLKITGYESRARFGDFADAIRLGEATDTTPSVALVRRYRGHAGIALDWEQPVADDAGVFARTGYADGHQQSYEFTDVNRTVAAGVSVQGKRWGRPDDTVALAGVVNDVSEDFRAYLAAGGLGILIGDGQLPHYESERIIETYYNYKLAGFAHLSVDYQFIDNPAYDRSRGPVNILAVRLHLQGIAP